MKSVIVNLNNKASTSLVTADMKCVEFDTTGMNVVNAITDVTVGVVVHGGATQSDVCIFGECKAIAGGVVTAGKMVVPHTDGTVTVTGGTATEFALALESGVAGDIVTIFVLGASNKVS